MNCAFMGRKISWRELDTIVVFQCYLRLLAGVQDKDDEDRIRLWRKRHKVLRGGPKEMPRLSGTKHYHDDSMYAFGGPPRKCRTCGKDPRL